MLEMTGLSSEACQSRDFDESFVMSIARICSCPRREPTLAGVWREARAGHSQSNSGGLHELADSAPQPSDHHRERGAVRSSRWNRLCRRGRCDVEQCEASWRSAAELLPAGASLRVLAR